MRDLSLGRDEGLGWTERMGLEDWIGKEREGGRECEGCEERRDESTHEEVKWLYSACGKNQGQNEQRTTLTHGHERSRAHVPKERQRKKKRITAGSCRRALDNRVCFVKEKSRASSFIMWCKHARYFSVWYSTVRIHCPKATKPTKSSQKSIP